MYFFFKQKTVYELLISDWSSDVCSSDLLVGEGRAGHGDALVELLGHDAELSPVRGDPAPVAPARRPVGDLVLQYQQRLVDAVVAVVQRERKSVVFGKGVKVRVFLGGRRLLK